MSMTVLATRDVADRFRGFLASCMLEIAPGIYTNPEMSSAVRDRVWAVMEEWFIDLGGGSIVMTWKDGTEPHGQAIRSLGTPPVVLTEADGVWLARREPRANLPGSSTEPTAAVPTPTGSTPDGPLSASESDG